MMHIGHGTYAFAVDIVWQLYINLLVIISREV